VNYTAAVPKDKMLVEATSRSGIVHRTAMLRFGAAISLCGLTLIPPIEFFDIDKPLPEGMRHCKRCQGMLEKGERQENG